MSIINSTITTIILITVIRVVIAIIIINSTSQDFYNANERMCVPYKPDAYNTEGGLAPFPSS